MELIPAIDLIEGGVVRLFQGDARRVIRYPQDPVELARSLAAAGAPRLHLVDLDGAFAGSWRNLAAIAAIAAAVAPVPVQAGGGARDLELVRAGLASGVDRVIVGTAACESVEKVGEWAAELGSRLVVSLDSRGGRLLGRGWTEESGLDLVSLARALAAAGVRRLVHTDVGRDGTLAGAGLEGLRALAPVGLPILVAGGIASYADLQALRQAGAEGAIVGRALLEGRIELDRALEAAAGPAG